jgi:SPFH domain / Band 7 family
MAIAVLTNCLAARRLPIETVLFAAWQRLENQIVKVELWPVDRPMPSTRAPSRWRRFLESHLPSVVIYLMVATLVAVVLYPHMVITVPSGQVGVLWKRFGGGTVLDARKLKNEGFNLILPWNRVFLYDLRLQSFTEHYNAISSDGVSLTARVIFRFR